MSDTKTITINREKDYHAFEAEGAIKAGLGNESFEAKLSVDVNVTAGTLALTATIAGLKIDLKGAALAMTAEKGPKYEMFNGVSIFGAQLKAKGMLAHAKAVMTETESVLTEVNTELATLKANVTQVTQSNVAVQTDIQAVI